MPNFNPDGHADDELIEDARMAAESDWEEAFVNDIMHKRARYGKSFELTDGQREKLQQIAGY